MTYENITRQHILDAVEKIEREGIPLKPSTKYDVLINNKAYPPKAIMRYANLLANGANDWPFGGGEPTNKYLRAFNFDILAKGVVVANPPFSTNPPLTGNIWKLGCFWGPVNEKPSFYEMIKAHSIVIGVDKFNYQPGDLVVITEGHTVYALAKILEPSRPVTNAPQWEHDFEAHQIEYESWVTYATAEWYELPEDDIFHYQLRAGISVVNSPFVRNKAIALWNDRFINYWLFQCNPAEYNFEAAIKSNLLHDWKVSNYKDHIKKGDKVILWLTGKRAGCYALARITSDPAEPEGEAPDKDLWKAAPNIPFTAGIELTHNLVDAPLLWQHIKETDGLQDLKAGNPGTNFTVTPQQYKTILQLIDKNVQYMNNRIDLFLNTILYGPPGTGKTYKLNEYKTDYFTDTHIPRSPEEALKEKVATYPFWKVLGAVLSAADKPLTVNELTEHPLVKAKIKTTTKTNPKNLAWADLQSYADDASTQLAAKYRRSVKLFHKNGDIQWSIADDKKAELSNIINQELLDLAANPTAPSAQSTAPNPKTRFNFITFHQKYSYEDFIEGIKPLLQEEDSEDLEQQAGDLQFELKKGVFYNSCLEALQLVGYTSFKECHIDTPDNRAARFEAARNDPSKQFALFIDEINRANIAAVFGELITLLEDDKRIGAPNEMWVELPYSREKFCVPGNLYVIGTMNTADRSIALLDVALRRRFEFKALYPQYMEHTWWAPLLEAINLAIYNWKKNPDFFIGHAFFIDKPETDRVRILNTKIIPLLYEYCQNNADTVKQILTTAGIQFKPADIRENFKIVAE